MAVVDLGVLCCAVEEVHWLMDTTPCECNYCRYISSKQGELESFWTRHAPRKTGQLRLPLAQLDVVTGACVSEHRQMCVVLQMRINEIPVVLYHPPSHWTATLRVL